MSAPKFATFQPKAACRRCGRPNGEHRVGQGGKRSHAYTWRLCPRGAAPAPNVDARPYRERDVVRSVGPEADARDPDGPLALRDVAPGRLDGATWRLTGWASHRAAQVA